jgi:hypothetical protein
VKEQLIAFIDMLRTWDAEADRALLDSLWAALDTDIPADVEGASTDGVATPLRRVAFAEEFKYGFKKRFQELLPILVPIDGVTYVRPINQNEWTLLTEAGYSLYMYFQAQVRVETGSSALYRDTGSEPTTLNNGNIYLITEDLESISVSDYPKPPILLDGVFYVQPENLHLDFLRLYEEVFQGSTFDLSEYSDTWEGVSYYTLVAIIRAEEFLPFEQLVEELINEDNFWDVMRRGFGDVLAWITDNIITAGTQKIRELLDNASILFILYEENPEATILSLEEFGRQNPQYAVFASVATQTLTMGGGSGAATTSAASSGSSGGFGLGITLAAVLGIGLALVAIKAWMEFKKKGRYTDEEKETDEELKKLVGASVDDAIEMAEEAEDKIHDFVSDEGREAAEDEFYRYIDELEAEWGVKLGEGIVDKIHRAISHGGYKGKALKKAMDQALEEILTR